MNVKIQLFLIFSMFSFVCINGMSRSNLRANEDLMMNTAIEDVGKIQRSLDMGADVNFQKGQLSGMRTPLYYAITNSCLGVVKCLVYNGANLNIELFYNRDLKTYNALGLAKKVLEYNIKTKKECPKLVVIRDFDKAYEVIEFLEKHAKRMQKIQATSLKYVTDKVNGILSQVRRAKINDAVNLPAVLEDVVLNYCELYPNKSEDFYKLSDQEIDDIIKNYSDEFEKKEINEKVDRIYDENCLIM